jgi:hypothetical protein
VKAFEISGFIKDGVLKLRNAKTVAAEFDSWPDCEVTVTVEKAHATRSLDANALYWVGYVGPVAEYTGYSINQIHAYFKRRFLPKQRIEIVDKKTGAVVEETDLDQLTTTVLNKVEFGEYLNDIKDWVEETFHGTVTVGSNREAA